jgi:1,4-alpha-glucan branching enzyme
MTNNPVMQLSRPCPSTWGHKGYNEIWLNSANDWIYKHLYEAAEMMIELANEYFYSEGLLKKALNQAARELLLAQGSDWAFIMKAGTMVKYAEMRIKDHLNRFIKLYHDIKDNNIDIMWLKDLEFKDNIFPEIDFRLYSKNNKFDF